MNVPMGAIANADLDKDMLINWINENIDKRYVDINDAYRAFTALSNATIFSSRAVVSQYYTYWRYMNVYMSSGVALSKKQYPDTTVRYTFPKIIKELSLSKSDRATATLIAKKMQKKIKFNLSKIKREYIPLISKQLQKSQAPKEEMHEYLEKTYNLSAAESDWLISKTY